MSGLVSAKMNEPKPREVLEENLLEGAHDLRLGLGVTFHHGNDLKARARTPLQSLWNKKPLKALEWPGCVWTQCLENICEDTERQKNFFEEVELTTKLFFQLIYIYILIN